MDISRLPQSTQSPPLLPTGNINSLNLKLNQQLDAKVIKSYINTQILALQIPNSDKPLEVQTNLPIQTKPGQSFQLLVTKLSPAVEFTVLASNSEIKASSSSQTNQPAKPISLNELVFKQLIPNTSQTKSILSSSIQPTVFTAKIIAIHEDKIQLKLYTTPTAHSTKTQPTLLNTEVLANTQHPFSPAPTALSKITEQPSFQVQNKELIGQKPNHTPQKSGGDLPFIDKFKTFGKNTIITLRKEDLITPDVQSGQKKLKPQQLQELPNFKLDQKIQFINISEQNASPKYKIIDSTPAKLNTGQIINATVLNIYKNNVQLQLHMSNLAHRDVATFDRNSINQTHVITLNKSQLIRQSPNIKIPETIIKNSATDLEISRTNINNISGKNAPPIETNNLKRGQLIKFEVIKTGNRPEFKLLKNEPIPNSTHKTLETLKQVLPIQESPSELVNQLIKNLPTINKNQSIPENLKQLAREILNNIPQIKNEKPDPKLLKQSTLNSGLFLEAKLSRPVESNGLNLDVDFKSQLLKLDHALKQELDVNNLEKLQLSDIDLIKEMQQKTESTLAKIILNQLSSLPKEDGTRQTWILDLPFLNKEFSESVKIEINREQKKEEDTKQENWAVTITITPPELGPIHCKVSCFDKTINTLFWSDTEDIVEKITQNLDYLKTKLEKAGLDIGHMSAHSGPLNKETPPNISNQNLFDQKA